MAGEGEDRAPPLNHRSLPSESLIRLDGLNESVETFVDAFHDVFLSRVLFSL